MNRRGTGQGLVEYALILVLVAVVVIAILALLGPEVGNNFSKIVYALRGAESPGYPNYALVDYGLRHNEYGSQPVDVESALEKLEVLWEAAEEQELSLFEASDMLAEAVSESLEAPFEYALDTGDESLIETLSAMTQNVENGDMEAARALFAELVESPISLPPDVLVAAGLKYVPRAIKVCRLLKDQEIDSASFTEARQAVLLLGNADAAVKMDVVWDLIDQRNGAVEDVRLAMDKSSKIWIEVVQTIGDPEHINLAEEFEEDLFACED